MRKVKARKGYIGFTHTQATLGSEQVNIFATTLGNRSTSSQLLLETGQHLRNIVYQTPCNTLQHLAYYGCTKKGRSPVLPRRGRNPRGPRATSTRAGVSLARQRATYQRGTRTFAYEVTICYYRYEVTICFLVRYLTLGLRSSPYPKRIYCYTLIRGN